MRVLFLFKSEKKTDEGHFKQMREGLKNNSFFFALTPKISLILAISILFMSNFNDMLI